jgi:hypothetical protein
MSVARDETREASLVLSIDELFAGSSLYCAQHGELGWYPAQTGCKS